MNRLRKNFIMIAMASMFLVLALIVGIINVVNYHNVVTTADNTLTYLTYNNGNFPNFDNTDESVPEESPPAKPDDSEDTAVSDDIAPPEKPSVSTEDLLPEDMERLESGFSSETPYESRYFSILFNESGSVETVNTSRISAIDTEAAIEYAQNAYSLSANTGFLDNYRYLKADESGKIRITFLDCRNNLTNYRYFLFTSAGISLLGLLAVFALIFIFSGMIFKPVKESNEKQKQFITDAGHEIKTPLAIIRADADVLEMDLGEDNEWLTDIRSQTARLTDLTNNLVLLSRMEESGNQVVMIDFPFSDLADEISQSFVTLAQSRNRTLVRKIEPFLTVNGDEKNLRQLLSILLENAVKYSKEGTEISFSIEKEGKHLQLQVQNRTEQPMEKDSLSHVFDRFYRTDKSRNSSTGGNGIGLAVAKAVTEQHKGKIAVSLPEPDLFTISVQLPLVIEKQ